MIPCVPIDDVLFDLYGLLAILDVVLDDVWEVILDELEKILFFVDSEQDFCDVVRLRRRIVVCDGRGMLDDELHADPENTLIIFDAVVLSFFVKEEKMAHPVHFESFIVSVIDLQ